MGGRIQELGIGVEESGLGQAALVQAALVSAVHREAQQVCMARGKAVSQDMLSAEVPNLAILGGSPARKVPRNPHIMQHDLPVDIEAPQMSA